MAEKSDFNLPAPTIGQGWVIDEKTDEVEQRLADCLVETIHGTAEAVMTVRAIRDKELWRGHMVPDEAGGQRPAFSSFWLGYLPWLLANRLPNFHTTSLGWWKYSLRHLDAFLPLGYSPEEILATPASIRLRLEKVLLFERRTRRLLGLRPGMQRQLLPGVSENTTRCSTREDDYQLALQLVETALRGEPRADINYWLRDLEGKPNIRYVIDSGEPPTIGAVVWSSDASRPAVQKFDLSRWPQWPEFVRRDLFRRLGVKTRDELAEIRQQSAAAAGDIG